MSKNILVEDGGFQRIASSTKDVLDSNRNEYVLFIYTLNFDFSVYLPLTTNIIKLF